MKFASTTITDINNILISEITLSSLQEFYHINKSAAANKESKPKLSSSRKQHNKGVSQVIFKRNNKKQKQQHWKNQNFCIATS